MMSMYAFSRANADRACLTRRGHCGRKRSESIDVPVARRLTYPAPRGMSGKASDSCGSSSSAALLFGSPCGSSNGRADPAIWWCPPSRYGATRMRRAVTQCWRQRCIGRRARRPVKSSCLVMSCSRFGGKTFRPARDSKRSLDPRPP
jgi:hypothetical protein